MSKDSVTTNFAVDRNGWVIAKLPDNGTIKTQSVEALLMLSILNKLEEVRYELWKKQ